MAAIITQIYRYPVKGLSAEPLDRVARDWPVPAAGPGGPPGSPRVRVSARANAW
jgi:hypothetical protein